MKIITRLAAAAAVVASVFAAAPAQAESDPYAPTATPEITYPLYRTAGAPAEGDAVVQLEASGKAWGIRRIAKRFDAQVPGLTIRTTGTCAANPTARCVRVEVGTYNEARQHVITNSSDATFMGLCICSVEGTRTLLLNRFYNPSGTLKESIAAHELGHALGLGHHEARGAVSTKHTGYDRLGAAELGALRAWYSVPRFAPAV